MRARRKDQWSFLTEQRVDRPWKANIRKKSPRPGKAGPADFPEGGIAPFITPLFVSNDLHYLIILSLVRLPYQTFPPQAAGRL